MKASSPYRIISVILLTAFILLPVFQAPSSVAEDVRSVTYHFDFPEPNVDMEASDRLYAIPGLELDARGGVPALPFRSVLLAVPPGHGLVDIDVRCASPRTVEIIDRYPVNPQEMTLGGLTFSYDYQGRPYEVAGSYMLEGVEVVGLDLHPLYWDEGTGALAFISEIAVELTFEERATGYIGDLDRVRDLVDNPQAVPDLPRSSPSGVLPAGDYDHLIITSQELSAPFIELSVWKGERNGLGSVHPNVRSMVVPLDHILGDSHFWGDPRSHGRTGNDTQTIVRNFIIAAHREWGVQYVLLGGDDEVIPARMLQSPIYDTDHDELPGDIYYSGLDGSWDTDGDGIYGELLGALNADEADLLAEVFVGRATVSTVDQAWNFVNKTIAYEMGYSNLYEDDILLIGEKLDDEPTYGDDYKEEVWDLVLADEGMERSTLYAEDGTFSASAVLAAMGSDVHVINHMGHGNFGYLAGLVNNNVRGLDNELPFIFYTQACMVAGFDEKSYSPGDCIAEEFVQGEGGTVAFIGNSRYGWYSPGSTAGSSQRFDISFFEQVYDKDVTDLGRALSYSKERWAVSASSSGSMRWVYLELNLLGDPETRVHLPGRETHDLAVRSVDADRSILGEAGRIAVRVQNCGQSDDAGILRVFADGAEVGNASISLGPGESTIVSVEWTPAEHRVTEITARIICAQDQRADDDQMSIRLMVDRRVTADETWTGDRTLTGGLLIEPLATVRMVNCNVTLQPSDLNYRITILGGLSLEGSVMLGSPFSFDSEGGDLEIAGSYLAGMSAVHASTLSGGSLCLRDVEIAGGSGWRSNGTSVVVRNATLVDQEGEWRLSNSTADLEGLAGQGGDGIRLWNMTGSVTSSSWTMGSSGLSVDRCSGMVLRDLSFLGNGMDMGVFGDARTHFEHEAENVSLTFGTLQILQGLDGASLENVTGSLYLVGCHDVVVRSSLLARAGNGLALVDCSAVEIVGNAIENCSVGLMALDTQGLAWGNDVLFNEQQAVLVRSSITFGKEYPIGGNHWSDMTGTDVKKGEGQDLAGEDGMFDAAYDVEGVYDRYPKVGMCSLPLDHLEASFTMDKAQADRVAEVTFTSTGRSGIGVANWTWDLGDGHLAFGPSVAHTYSSLGLMAVRLTVTDHYGRNDSTEKEVQVVNLGPTCDFDISPEGPAPGESVQFHDLSTDVDGGVTSWSWDFGDGGTSTERSPSHIYADEGDYLVSLTVHDSDGAVGTRDRLLAVGNDPPVAAFSWSPASVTILMDVQFTSLSTDPDGSLASWNWDFGDGSSGSGAAVKHRYHALGTYTVTLTVTDEDGASASLSKVLTVINSRPVAAFSAPNEVMSLLDVHFEDRSYDLDGNIAIWSWSFGDGATSSERSPSHLYLRPGQYLVNLTVTDDRGWTAKATSSIAVTNRLPSVNMTVPSGEHHSLDSLEFSASGSDRDGMVVNYIWDMGDGTVLYGENVTHAYLTPGNYTITVTCRDDSGGEASNSSEMTVLNLPPSAEIRIEQGDHPLELVFTAHAEDDDGLITSYTWNFGDGTYGEGAQVRHRYAQEGSYQVGLTVTDDAGGVSETEEMATVLSGNLFLSEMRLEHVRGTGWEISGEIWNEGTVKANVTLSVDAGGERFIFETDVEGGGFEPFHLPLADFEGGRVNVTLIAPEGWETDLEDNTWSDEVEPRTPSIYWIAGGAAIAMAAAAVMMYAKRRR